MLVPLVPAGLVTVTSRRLAVPAGGIAVMRPALLTEKLAAAVAPNLTADAPAKPEPVIDTELPPVLGPEKGVTAATVGAVVIVP